MKEVLASSLADAIRREYTYTWFSVNERSPGPLTRLAFPANNRTRGSERMKEVIDSSLGDAIPANKRTRGSLRMKEVLASSLADAIPANNRTRF